MILHSIYIFSSIAAYDIYYVSIIALITVCAVVLELILMTNICDAALYLWHFTENHI